MNIHQKIQLIAMVSISLMAGCKKTTSTSDPVPQAPTIVVTSPGSNATGVSRNKAISIAFSETMNASTINTSSFTLMKGTVAIPGTVVYSGTTAVFTASSTNLMANSMYTVTVTTAAKSSAGIALAANNQWSFTTGMDSSGLLPVNLGAAGNYVILAKSAINNNPTSAITGDLGLSPAAASYITGLSLTAATGYATSSQVTGKLYAADMVSPTPTNLTTAVNNMATAYNDAAGRPTPDYVELGSGNIGGKTLAPGLYKWSGTVTAPTNVTLSGGPSEVWIFQIAGNLMVSSAVKFTLSGGAQTKNIFWQVAGQATIGTTAHFEGILLSMTGITLKTGASLNGRIMAQTAAILDANTVTKPQ